MVQPTLSPYLVPFDGSFILAKAPTSPPKSAPGKKKLEEKLQNRVDELSDLQRLFFARDSESLLLVFQAMDAAGKDGTIRAVMTGVNPAGCQVFGFKQPSHLELDHDFLWRSARRLPERGRFGIFNRSYYEEVLVVRVHPHLLEQQKLPKPIDMERIWTQRYESIRDHEKHLARNGTIVLKFWLNVSRDEQRQRFLDRIDEGDKHWKFSATDVQERERWDDYMHAYQEALRATSTSWGPWYAIPADSKPFMRLQVADIIVKTLRSLKMEYPKVDAKQRKQLEKLGAALDEGRI